MNFTRWSPRFPGTQRRTTRRADTGAVPAARAGTDPTGPAARLEDLPVRAVLDRVPALVAVLQGPAHHIAYVNDAYTEAFGVRPIGTPADETMPELEELGLLTLLDQVLRSGRPRTVKSRRLPGGRSYTFTCTPITVPTADDSGAQAEDGDAQSAESGVLVFAADVTDQADAAERLRASERRQRETAVTLQRSLLPQELEQPDDLRIAATYQPGGADAAVGGGGVGGVPPRGGRPPPGRGAGGGRRGPALA
ncbi:PAS sensor protein, partial [Streptomyces albidoflavus]